METKQKILLLTLLIPLTIGLLTPVRAQAPGLGVNGSFAADAQIMPIAAGATFTISVDVRDIPDFTSYDLRVGFDSLVLDATNVAFTGCLLATNSFTVLPSDLNNPEESPGIVHVVQALLGTSTFGSGCLFKLTFRVLSATTAPSNSPIDVGCNGDAIGPLGATVAVCSASTLQDAIIDVNFNPVPHTTFNAIVNPPLVVDHNTTTSVVCTPASVVVNQATQCTATVMDTAATGATTPTGTVSFISSGSGTFIGSPCTLTGTGASASCSVSYTPTPSAAALPRTDTVTASYSGDMLTPRHLSSSGTATVMVNKRATSTAVVCTPGTVVVNQASSCLVTVTDTSLGTAITPSGTVALTSSGAGTFTVCSLSGSGAIATCSSSYTPSPSAVALPRTDTITANYPTNANQLASSGTGSVLVNPRATSTNVTCATPVVINQGSSCTATVTDISPGTLITPAGTVSFAVSGVSGSAPNCTLVAGVLGTASCVSTFTATTSGTASITGTYGGSGTHSGSTDTTPASVLVNPRATATTVACAPAQVIGGSETTSCTATVMDTSLGTKINPAGTVGFTSSGSGSFTGSPCTLAPTATLGTSSCSVTYAPTSTTVSRTDIITGTYTPTSPHVSSSGTFSLIVNPVGDHSTSTSVVCTPASVVVNQATQCTATVTDTAATGATTPAGTVGFTSSGSGSFTGSPCTLSGTGPSASCSVSYTPSAVGIGTHTITGSYSGDSLTPRHLPSQGSAQVTVSPRATATTVACAPASVVVNQATQCTATVMDTSAAGTKINPAGTVGFTSSGSGSFTGSPCTLAPTATLGTSSCSVSYTPSAVGIGTHTITASYTPTSAHMASSGNTAVTVSPRATATTVACAPASVVVNQATQCTATVMDTSLGTKINPAGTVGFTSSGSGSFTGSPCTLAPTATLGTSSCSVTYTPSAVGTGTHTITGSYGGSGTHDTSSGTATVTVVKRDTSTAVACTPGTVVVGQVTSCTATVTDTSAGTSTPTGSVSFMSSGAGSFSPAASCTLSGTGDSASCSVNYTPSGAAPRTDTITGTYGGSGTHNTSSGTTPVNVEPAVFDYSLAVSPDPVTVVQGSSSGTVTVTATLISGATQSVSFSLSALPSGVTASVIASCSPTCSSTFTFTASPTATLGTVTVTITGTSTGGVVRTDTFQLTVERVRRDLAVTNVVPSITTARTNKFVGDPVMIAVTVANQGDVSESNIEVTVKAGPAIIACTANIASLAAGATTTVSCTWDTAADAPGIYTISASVPVQTGETDTADNTFTDGTVTLVLSEPRFVRGKLSWTHHLSLVKNANMQTWEAKVRNDAPAQMYVQVVITGSAGDGIQPFTAHSQVILMPEGQLRLDIAIQQSFTSSAIGLKFCFTADVIYSNSAVIDPVTGLLVGTAESVVHKSGCFAVVA